MTRTVNISCRSCLCQPAMAVRFAIMLIWPLVAAFTTTSPLPAAAMPRARQALAATESPRVFLTREEGKNDKLRSLLTARGILTEELPCIAFNRLPGYDKLCEALVANAHDWVVMTSPEAAGVFIEAWRSSGTPPLAKLATVGAGTAQALAKADLSVDFVPSKATGKTLAAELPTPEDASEPGLVLYPASALAAGMVEAGLESRGFSTRRIETYTTVPAAWSEDDAERARAAEIVTFASPSAVRAWAERVGTAATAVCIGETSAEECRRVGFASESVHCPEKPGVESWAETVVGLVTA